MKKLTGILLVAVVILLSSCGAKKAREFNDKLVGIQKEIVSQVELIMKGSNETENRAKAKEYIDRKLAELKKIEPVSGGESFKQAMVDDFNGLAMVYDLAVKLDKPGVTAEEEKEFTAQQKDWLAKINIYDENVLEEQRKFAKAKGFKLENR